jgi:Legume lectin domain/Chitobiase/beta-hexosaminidase C-terminal domain
MSLLPRVARSVFLPLLPNAALQASRRRRKYALLIAGLLCAATGPHVRAQVNVVTQHNDISRTGQNTAETLLTPANVNSSQFGLLFSRPVDGQIYAQPLYLAGLQIPGAGTHNVVFVETENDTVYAFDADSNGGSNQAPLWQASMVSTAHGASAGATAVSSLEIAEDIVPIMGITGTPVIDPAAGILYLVSYTLEGSSYFLRLHALNVLTGAEMKGSPVNVQASVPGTGTGSSSGVLNLDPKWENQRPGLLLLNGILYVGFASHADNGDWHGWVTSYNPSTLAQISVFCTSPNGVGSGVWMSGEGLPAEVVDPVNHPYGRMFIPTGNGDYTATTPYASGMDFGDSILDLDLTNGALTIDDEFTPSNQAQLTASDGDLGSGGIVILPNQAGANAHLLVQEGKGGEIYLLNRDNLGGYGTTDNVVEEFSSTVLLSGLWGAPTYWNGNVYVEEKGHAIKAYPISKGVLSKTPASVSPETFLFPGPATSVSSNGTADGILWAVEADSYDTGGISVVRAYDATNLANELYSSAQVSARDSAGPAVKFATPTVSNGKVYVGTGNQLDVYGLFNSEPLIATPVIQPGSTTFTSPVSVTITDATPGAQIYYTTDGSMPSTSSTPYTGAFTVNSTETVTAIAVAPGSVWIAPASATYTSLNTTATPIFSPPGGIFATSPMVTITDASPNAAIYYTTDGSAPSANSTLYQGPIQLTGSATLQAVAFASGLGGSVTAAATYTTESQVDFSQGFSQAQSIMTFNGSTGLDDSRLQLTNGYTGDTGTAWVTTPLNIQAFNTEFLFELSNAEADGFTFTIQNDSPTVIGAAGPNKGSGGLAKSVSIKFDFYNSAGEGKDSTGLYINGATPTIPALNLTSSGVILASGDSIDAQITYDGTNLAMTLTDFVTGAEWGGVWQVNIPQIVGSTSAYVGFTGSTQILTASQKIVTWIYNAVAPGQPSPTATPTITPAAGWYANAQTVTLADATPNAAIYYTTDGSPATTSSNLYIQPFQVTSSEKITVMAMAANDVMSGTTSSTFAIQSGVTAAVPAYPQGFALGSLVLNGASISTTSLQLTDGSLNEAHSAYFTNPVNIQSFTTDFDFQMLKATGEGFTFVIQNTGLNSIGTWLGYGVSPSGGGASIANSVAIKFSVTNDSGEGTDSVGIYVEGASPTVPANDLTATKVLLNSGHEIHVHLVYNGTNLVLTLTDSVSGATATETYPINIPAAVGANTAYVGFTGATSATAAATQNILDWTYSVTPVVTSATATPVITPNGGVFASPTVATITDATAGAVIYYTTNGNVPTTASAVYTGPINVDVTGTIRALAAAPGETVSSVASASFTVQSPGVTYPSGFTSQGLILNGGAVVNGSVLELTDGGSQEARSAYFSVPVNVQGFTTDFDFQLLNAKADGFTFVVQNQGPTAIGSVGGGLGYGAPVTGAGRSIANSVAVKFDIYNNSGEGADSTGLYEDGASPTLPATNLVPTGIVLNSGHELHAHIVYDGTNLTLTITDTTTNPVASATEVYPVNIPAIVGANTAYVGFTAGAGGNSSIQEILDWVYTPAGSQSVATATPAIAPNAGSFTSATLVTITDATPGAVIYYTTNGTTPSTNSPVYTWPFPVNITANVQAIAIAPGDTASPISAALFTIQDPAASFTTAFTKQGLTLNGAAIKGTLLQLTDGSSFEARSAYYTTPLNVQAFVTDFDFQLLNAVGDGFTFVIQNQGLNAVGSSGGGLGYGLSPAGNAPSIARSVAVKFDIYSNSGEGPDSTGIYLDGATPTLPATNLTTSGITLASGDVIHAHIVYDGNNLTLTVTDATANAAVTEVYPVNIPAVVGSNTAFVGFTGGSGKFTAVQDILDWTYATSLPAAAPPVFTPAGGATTLPQTVTITDATPSAVIYYTTDGTTPGPSSKVYSSTAPPVLSAAATVQAVAIAPGGPVSPIASAVYTAK